MNRHTRCRQPSVNTSGSANCPNTAAVYVAEQPKRSQRAGLANSARSAAARSRHISQPVQLAATAREDMGRADAPGRRPSVLWGLLARRTSLRQSASEVNGNRSSAARGPAPGSAPGSGVTFTGPPPLQLHRLRRRQIPFTAYYRRGRTFCDGYGNTPTEDLRVPVQGVRVTTGPSGCSCLAHRLPLQIKSRLRSVAAPMAQPTAPLPTSSRTPALLLPSS